MTHVIRIGVKEDRMTPKMTKRVMELVYARSFDSCPFLSLHKPKISSHLLCCDVLFTLSVYVYLYNTFKSTADDQE